MFLGNTESRQLPARNNMKAILTIGHTDYLVPDARKALAFVEMLQKSQEIRRSLLFRPDQIELSDEPVRAEMRVLRGSIKIIPAKKGRKKIEEQP